MLPERARPAPYNNPAMPWLIITVSPIRCPSRPANRHHVKVIGQMAERLFAERP